ncbi:hypothetical protein FM076_25950 [Streptomyces albus subsp. chlorinus]|uniref:hypothetical protein n=1 Tax=Streptomyces albus TaxID=1888 RepID=UPI00156FE3F9|nr:hypothetical protein [Streptomyces albus]NSC24408.1 hypothetical protein [Streptomyces albus subsp. chlorinus]
MTLVVTFTGRTPLGTAGTGLPHQIWSYSVQPGFGSELRLGQRVALALPADADVRDPRLFPGVPALEGMFLEPDGGLSRVHAGRVITTPGPQTLAVVAPPAQQARELFLVTRSGSAPWTVTPFATAPGEDAANTQTLPAPAPVPRVPHGRPVTDFGGTLPYASELFGVYQPLPGWLGYSAGSRLAVAAGGARPSRELFTGEAARALDAAGLAGLAGLLGSAGLPGLAAPPGLAALAATSGPDGGPAPLALPQPPTEGILSPVGLVDLFREYFFEFDTFLGAPVGHLWLSPGGTVEVVETATRRTLVERTAEQSEESVSRAEENLTDQTDVADAVKEDNANETSLGVTANAGASYVGIVHGDVSTSYSTKNTTNKSSEVTHKHSRTQSTKVSSEIHRNFKTTFKTVTETTDTSSRRYVVQNTTDRLVNYELRRKMRKVGVQVQHIGTQMSWQVFVGDPGRGLGLGELLHVVEAPDLTSLKKPVPPEPLGLTQTTYTDIYPVQQHPDSRNGPHLSEDWTLQQGFDRLWHGHSDEYLVAHFDYTPVAPGPGYTLSTKVEKPVRLKEAKAGNGSGTKFLADYEVVDHRSGQFRVNCKLVNFANSNYVSLTFLVYWDPPAENPAQDAYERELAEYRKEVAKLQRTAYTRAVRERVELVSKVRRRPAEELRKEERQSVFANLISQLDLFHGSSPHLGSELIRQMFDVDRMLYFVAPDFWRPGAASTAGERSRGRVPVAPYEWDRIDSDPLAGATVPSHYSHTAANNPPEAAHPVNLRKPEWRINYPLTENAQTAPMGSSLGWLIQADGDERRNEFLNSAWVKAVLPIRPGHEVAALGWLMGAHVEGEAALGKPYTWQTGDPDAYRGKTIGEVLELRARELQEKNTDVANTLRSERVFETGFDPLDGGFRPAEPYQVFDQWVEVLPTDQVVAVEVEYDPRTGQQR